jgi:hypothetical protein
MGVAITFGDKTEHECGKNKYGDLFLLGSETEHLPRLLQNAGAPNWIIAQGKIENRGFLDEYEAKVSPTIKCHQGRVVVFDE